MNVGVYQASVKPYSVRLQKVNITGCGSPCNAGGDDFSLGKAALFLKILLCVIFSGYGHSIDHGNP